MTVLNEKALMTYIIRTALVLAGVVLSWAGTSIVKNEEDVIALQQEVVKIEANHEVIKNDIKVIREYVEFWFKMQAVVPPESAPEVVIVPPAEAKKDGPN